MAEGRCSPCGSTGSGSMTDACPRYQGSPRPGVNSIIFFLTTLGIKGVFIGRLYGCGIEDLWKWGIENCVS